MPSSFTNRICIGSLWIARDLFGAGCVRQGLLTPPKLTTAGLPVFDPGRPEYPSTAGIGLAMRAGSVPDPLNELQR